MKLNEKGYATVSILILAPALIAALAVLNASFVVLKQDGFTRHSCRVDLLNAQTKVSRDLVELLALNPSATELREEREAAEQLVEETIATPAVVAAEADLAQVIVRQLALAAKQKALIARAKLTSRTAPRLAIGHVRSLLENENRLEQAERSVSSTFQSHVRTGEFAVVAEPENSLTPNYRTADDFSARQEMKAEWAVDASALVPPWLKKIIPATGFSMKADCSTTLTKENLAWQSKMTMGKRSLSSFSPLSF